MFLLRSVAFRLWADFCTIRLVLYPLSLWRFVLHCVSSSTVYWLTCTACYTKTSLPYASNVHCDIFADRKRHLPCVQSYYTIRYLISIVWQHRSSQRSTMCSATGARTDEAKETTKERRRQIYIPIQLLDPGDRISSSHDHRSLVIRAQLWQHRLVTLSMWSDTCSNTHGRNLKIMTSRQLETAQPKNIEIAQQFPASFSDNPNELSKEGATENV
jgi:hypothetical protein